MKQKSVLWGMLLAIILLYGCANQTQPAPTQAAQNQPGSIETASTEATVKDEHPEELACAAADGFVTAQSVDSNTPCHVRLMKYRDDEAPPAEFGYDLYIEIDTGTAVLKKA